MTAHLYCLAARQEPPRRGYVDGWTALLLKDGDVIVLSGAHLTAGEALRAAEFYRYAWEGQTAPGKRLWIRVDGEVGDDVDLYEEPPSLTLWMQDNEAQRMVEACRE